MIPLDEAHRSVHYPLDRRFRIWIRPSALALLAAIILVPLKLGPGGDYFASQARPSVIIFTSLPPLSGFTKMVSAASPRFRFNMPEAGVIKSLSSLVQPCALRFADNSAQTLFTFPLLLNASCSTRPL